MGPGTDNVNTREDALITKQSLQDTSVILSPSLGLQAKALGPNFYDEIESVFNGFHQHVLISQHTFDADWPSWEKHPAGDEQVILISGSAEFALFQTGVEQVTPLTSPGDYLIVPRNVWHTARILERTTCLFITPGEGTMHASHPLSSVSNAAGTTE